MNCPICNEQIPYGNYREYGGGSTIIEESHIECINDNCQYRYEFAYGYECEVIGNVSIKSSHSDSEEVVELKKKIRKLAVELINTEFLVEELEE